MTRLIIQAHNALYATLALICLFILPISAQSLPNLRIQTLGDSITKGSGSSDNNGYRGRLRDKILAYETSTDVYVDMIGSLRHGRMYDNDHEGHSGKYLADIAQYWKLSIKARPNLILIHAGTNNMDKEVDLDTAPQLIESIIDGLFREAPDAVILVAPVIWANDARMQANTDRFNHDLEAIILKKQQAQKHILSIRTQISAGDLSDRKHPNDRGYEKMASAWFSGIIEANMRGWISEPVPVNSRDFPGMGLGNRAIDGGSGSGSPLCAGGNWERKGTIFNHLRVWEDVGTVRTAVPGGSRDRLVLADLNNDGIADYIMSDEKGNVTAWINGGSPGQWTSLGKVNPSWKNVTSDMIRLADVDGDGRADLIVLYADGAAKVWKNTDNGKRFEALDSNWATGLETREKIRFEDIDGDGRADYVIIYKGGAVKWARNTGNNGKDPESRNWEKAEMIAPGPKGVPDNRVRLYDLDGDKKADYLIVYDGGAVKALSNTGNLNSNTGRRNWDDLGTIAPGVEGVTGDMIRFADMDGDGLADFLAVAQDGSIRMWKNLGILGSKGASLRFADLNGDGRDDVISVDKKGRAIAWLNKGVGQWESIGVIAPGPGGEDLSAARVEFADVNGDKLADYLIIYGGGAVKAFLNNGNIPDAGKGRIWSEAITISPGVGEPGDKVHFADLDGDGYADYLIVYDGGAVDYFKNNKNIPPQNGGRIWGERATVATGVGEHGSKVRFADITGDGRAEYLIQYLGGAATSYENSGNIPKVGSQRVWEPMGVIAGGVSPQGPVRYADINGDGKDDYLVVFGDGRVNAYINTCDWVRKEDPPSDGEEDNDDDDNDPDNDPDSGTAPSEIEPCEEEFSKVSQVLANKDRIESHCVNEYVLQGLEAELSNSLKAYDSLLDSDYNTKFGYFQKALKASFKASLDDFYDNRHNEFFNCYQQRADGRNSDGSMKWRNQTIECPPDNIPEQAFNIYLVPKDQKKLSKFLEDEYGISWEWISQERLEFGPCLPSPNDEWSCDDFGHFVGILKLRGDFRMPNPKDAIEEALDNVKDVREFLEDAVAGHHYGWAPSDGTDDVDATALPVYMVQAAVEAMEEVYEIGEEVQEKETERIILMVLTGFLFILPGVGAALSAVTGIASIARIAVIIAEAGGAGVGVYDIANNPDSAALGVFALLIGGLASMPTKGLGFVSKGAQARRAMSGQQVTDMGDTVKKGLDNVAALVKVCRRG